MTRAIDEFRCGRKKHVLATLTGDREGLVVEVHETAGYVDGVEANLRYYRTSDLDGSGAQLVTTTCPCGQRYVVDLVPPLTTRRFAAAGRIKTRRSPSDTPSTERRRTS